VCEKRRGPLGHFMGGTSGTSTVRRTRAFASVAPGSAGELHPVGIGMEAHARAHQSPETKRMPSRPRWLARTEFTQGSVRRRQDCRACPCSCGRPARLLGRICFKTCLGTYHELWRRRPRRRRRRPSDSHAAATPSRKGRLRRHAKPCHPVSFPHSSPVPLFDRRGPLREKTSGVSLPWRRGLKNLTFD